MEFTQFVKMLTDIEIIEKNFYGWYYPKINNCNTVEELYKVYDEIQIMKKHIVHKLICNKDKIIDNINDLNSSYAQILELYSDRIKYLNCKNTKGSLQSQPPGNDEVDYIESVRRALQIKNKVNDQVTNNINDILNKLIINESKALINGVEDDCDSSSCSDIEYNRSDSVRPNKE